MRNTRYLLMLFGICEALAPGPQHRATAGGWDGGDTGNGKKPGSFKGLTPSLRHPGAMCLPNAM